MVRRAIGETNAETVISPATVVVIFLRGGADGLMMVPPVDDAALARRRPTLRIKQERRLLLDGRFALHESLSALRPFLRRHQAVFVHGVSCGRGCRSHRLAQRLMEGAGGDESGWLARWVQATSSAHSPQLAVTAGATIPYSLRGAPACVSLKSLDAGRFDEDDGSFLNELAAWYAADGGPLSSSAGHAIDALRHPRFLPHGRSTGRGSVRYPAGEFGDLMRDLAPLLRADTNIAAAAADLHGWDTHSHQAKTMPPLMNTLAEGLSAFATGLGDAINRVTMVVMTEFGRRVRENASRGTDHGDGSLMMILGAGVREAGLGGRVVSPWPHLPETQSAGAGDPPAGIDFRDVLAAVLRACAPAVEMAEIFPGHSFSPLETTG